MAVLFVWCRFCTGSELFFHLVSVGNIVKFLDCPINYAMWYLNLNLHLNLNLDLNSDLNLNLNLNFI